MNIKRTTIVLLMCGALAACARPQDSVVGAPAGSSASPTVATSPTGSPTPSPTPTPAAPRPCDAKHVSVTVSDGQGAAGTLVQRFIVKNTGSGPCTMQKYPFISVYGPMLQGSTTVEANLDAAVSPIPSNFGELGADGGKQTLAPGGTAVFFFKWSHVPVNEQPCTEAHGFDFRPPQDPSTDDNLLVDFPFTPCGDVLQVSQILPPSVGS